MLRAVLVGSDPRLGLLAAQFERAPGIRREYPATGHFRVGPTSTFDDLTFPLEVERLDSEWLQVLDQRSNRELWFRVVIGRHGFLCGLEGRTADGEEWPRDWSVEQDLELPERPLVHLPSASEARAFQSEARDRLATLIGSSVPSSVELHPPAGEAAIALREQSIGGRFPAGVRVLEISDGLDARTIRVHGHADIYGIDNQFLPLALIAWDSDDEDEFIVAISLNGTDEAVYRVNVHDDEAEPSRLAEDFSSFLRERIGA